MYIWVAMDSVPYSTGLGVRLVHWLSDLCKDCCSLSIAATRPLASYQTVMLVRSAGRLAQTRAVLDHWPAPWLAAARPSILKDASCMHALCMPESCLLVVQVDVFRRMHGRSEQWQYSVMPSIRLVVVGTANRHHPVSFSMSRVHPW